MKQEATAPVRLLTTPNKKIIILLLFLHPRIVITNAKRFIPQIENHFIEVGSLKKCNY
jgi:hypothetical protein